MPLTSEAAHWYAELLCRRDRSGRAMATADAVMAATALTHGASLATRDGADFEDMGLQVINPWTSSEPLTPKIAARRIAAARQGQCLRHDLARLRATTPLAGRSLDVAALIREDPDGR